MPASFTSYWGSQVHGVEITWTCDYNLMPNVLTAAFTSNYYWRTQLYFDSANTADNDTALSQAIGTATSQDITGTSNNAYWVDSGLSGRNAGDRFRMYANFANPTSGAAIANDGFDAQVWFNPKRGDGTATVLPTMLVEWVRAIDALDTTAELKRDINQGTLFTTINRDVTTDNWRLLSTEMIHDDVGNQVAQTGTNLCKETWVFSNTAVACMKVTGTLERNMKVSETTVSPANTGDTTEDFDFDFVDT